MSATAAHKHCRQRVGGGTFEKSVFEKLRRVTERLHAVKLSAELLVHAVLLQHLDKMDGTRGIQVHSQEGGGGHEVQPHEKPEAIMVQVRALVLDHLKGACWLNVDSMLLNQVRRTCSVFPVRRLVRPGSSAGRCFAAPFDVIENMAEECRSSRLGPAPSNSGSGLNSMPALKSIVSRACVEGFQKCFPLKYGIKHHLQIGTGRVPVPRSSRV